MSAKERYNSIIEAIEKPEGRKMAERKPKKQYEEKFTLITPFANFQSGDGLIWTMYDQHMKFSQAGNPDNTATMEYSQLTDADYFANQENVNEKKRMFGNAAVGSMLMGRTGALIGAMKAMDNDGKGSKKTYYTVVLTYNGSDGQEHVIEFLDYRKKGGLAMVKTLREMLGKPTEPGSTNPPAGNVEL